MNNNSNATTRVALKIPPPEVITRIVEKPVVRTVERVVEKPVIKVVEKPVIKKEIVEVEKVVIVKEKCEEKKCMKNCKPKFSAGCDCCPGRNYCHDYGNQICNPLCNYIGITGNMCKEQCIVFDEEFGGCGTCIGCDDSCPVDPCPWGNFGNIYGNLGVFGCCPQNPCGKCNQCCSGWGNWGGYPGIGIRAAALASAPADFNANEFANGAAFAAQNGTQSGMNAQMMNLYNNQGQGQ
jgi:hypothetical protein